MNQNGTRETIRGEKGCVGGGGRTEGNLLTAGSLSSGCSRGEREGKWREKAAELRAVGIVLVCCMYVCLYV